VTVTLSGDGQDRLRAATGCPAATFDGWAVGGTLETPIVAAHPPGCGAFRLDLRGDDGVALPTGVPTPAPASTTGP
jgi:hypothetical protein